MRCEHCNLCTDFCTFMSISNCNCNCAYIQLAEVNQYFIQIVRLLCMFSAATKCAKCQSCWIKDHLNRINFSFVFSLLHRNPLIQLFAIYSSIFLLLCFFCHVPLFCDFASPYWLQRRTIGQLTNLFQFVHFCHIILWKSYKLNFFVQFKR